MFSRNKKSRPGYKKIHLSKIIDWRQRKFVNFDLDIKQIFIKLTISYPLLSFITCCCKWCVMVKNESTRKFKAIEDFYSWAEERQKLEEKVLLPNRLQLIISKRITKYLIIWEKFDLISKIIRQAIIAVLIIVEELIALSIFIDCRYLSFERFFFQIFDHNNCIYN